MPLTRQEVLDKAVQGIIDQNGPAYIPGKGCQYRAKVHGTLRRCHIGQFIPDEEYVPAWEGQGTGSTWEAADEILAAAGLDHLDRVFLGEFQSAHDMAADMTNAADMTDFWVDYRDNISGLCEAYDLVMPNVRYPDEEQVD